jgi:hypothetical protein
MGNLIYYCVLYSQHSKQQDCTVSHILQRSDLELSCEPECDAFTLTFALPSKSTHYGLNGHGNRMKGTGCIYRL